MHTNQETGTQRQEVDIDFSKLQRLILGSLDGIRTAQGKDVTLVIGNTGVGKSALINCIRGYDMIVRRTPTGPVLDVENPEAPGVAKIGHAGSCTWVPMTYFDSNRNLYYCDCPGFGDTRGPEERISVAITTELAVRTAGNIAGIILVIDGRSLYVDRGASFSKLCSTLKRLFKDFDLLGDKIKFIVTQTEDGLEQHHIVAKIQSEYDESLRRLSERRTMMENGARALRGLLNRNERLPDEVAVNPEDEELSNKLRVLKLLIDNAQNIMVVSRQQALNKSYTASIVDRVYSNSAGTEVSKEVFNFKAHDSERVKFDQLMDILYNTALKLLKIKAEYPSLIRGLTGEESDCEQSLLSNTAQLENLRGLNVDDLTVGVLEQRVRLVRDQQLRQNVDSIAEYEIKINERMEDGEPGLNQRIAEKAAEIQQVSSEEELPEPHYTESVSEPRKWWELFRRTHKDFEYNGIKYTRAEPTCANGSFKNEDKKPDTGDTTCHVEGKAVLYKGGRFKSTYVSGLYADGRAEVKIYVRKCDRIDSILRRQILEEEKKVLETDRDRINVAILALRRENEILRDLEQGRAEEGRRVIERQVGFVEASIRRTRERIGELQREILDKNRLFLEAGARLDESASLFVAVRTIAEILPSNSCLVQPFKNYYDQIHRQEMPHMFAAEQLQDTPLIESFRCPITRDIMREPVNTLCDHTFESSALREALAHSQTCPACRKPVRAVDLSPNSALRESIGSWLRQERAQRDTVVPSILDMESVEDVQTLQNEVTRCGEKERELQKQIDGLQQELARVKIDKMKAEDLIRRRASTNEAAEAVPRDPLIFRRAENAQNLPDQPQADDARRPQYFAPI